MERKSTRNCSYAKTGRWRHFGEDTTRNWQSNQNRNRTLAAAMRAPFTLGGGQEQEDVTMGQESPRGNQRPNVGVNERKNTNWQSGQGIPTPGTGVGGEV